MPVILLVGNKKDKSQEREIEKFDAERVRVIQPYKLDRLSFNSWMKNYIGYCSSGSS